MKFFFLIYKNKTCPKSLNRGEQKDDSFKLNEIHKEDYFLENCNLKFDNFLPSVHPSIQPEITIFV